MESVTERIHCTVVESCVGECVTRISRIDGTDIFQDSRKHSGKNTASFPQPKYLSAPNNNQSFLAPFRILTRLSYSCMCRDKRRVVVTTDGIFRLNYHLFHHVLPMALHATDVLVLVAVFRETKICIP